MSRCPTPAPHGAKPAVEAQARGMLITSFLPNVQPRVVRGPRDFSLSRAYKIRIKRRQTQMHKLNARMSVCPSPRGFQSFDTLRRHLQHPLSKLDGAPCHEGQLVRRRAFPATWEGDSVSAAQEKNTGDPSRDGSLFSWGLRPVTWWPVGQGLALQCPPPACASFALWKRRLFSEQACHGAPSGGSPSALEPPTPTKQRPWGQAHSATRDIQVQSRSPLLRGLRMDPWPLEPGFCQRGTASP